MVHSEKARMLLEMFGHGNTQAVPPPESAVRYLREGQRMTQTEVAVKSGVPQPFLAQIEGGVRRLTEETAAKLAPVLGVEADDLLLREQVASLQKAAVKGALDPEKLADGILAFADSAPDTDLAEDLVNGMIEVLRRASRTWEGAEVTTKNIHPSTRNVHGQRIDKPHDPNARPDEDDGRDPDTGRRRRDAMGRVIRKPYDRRT